MWLGLTGSILLMMSGQGVEAGKPVIMAHRGASADCPENTTSSIVEAAKQGAPVVEFDVRETSDGVLVLFHDKTFERFTGGKNTVEGETWDSIKDTDVGAWFTGGKFKGEKMPLFREALELCFEHDMIPLIEHKTGSAAAYAKVIKELDCADKIIVQSFNWNFLRDFQKELPDVKLGALGSKELTAERFTEIKGFAPDWVGWAFSDFTAGNLKALQSAGFLVTLWTVNNPEEAQKWIAAGIDGIITDKPQVMLDLAKAP
ncbi:MAG: glycerophosphodiester phosphodiesterase family protein [Verrucomicrobiales bacterium]|nr:glycerophosphodiester phosphodiesterase family protein [Verrucomicrobiales bacterium]